MQKAARRRLLRTRLDPITSWRRRRQRRPKQPWLHRKLRWRRQQQRRRQRRRPKRQRPGPEREPGQRRGPGPEQAPALPSCRKRPALRLQSGSPVRAISSFHNPFMGEKKQFPEIVRAAGMAALTEQQGLELLLFSPKLYAEKNKAGNPWLRLPCGLTSPRCAREKKASFSRAIRAGFPALRRGARARCR
jgi:hypothetical protein